MEPLAHGLGWIATAIGPETGSRHVLQRIFHLRRGRTSEISTGSAEEVLYVAGGRIRLDSDLDVVDALVGTGILVGASRQYVLVNRGKDDAMVVAVRPPPTEGSVTGLPFQDPIAAVLEDDREPLPAGDDRYFKLLIESSHFTQFVGFIEKSRAPFHTHTYEEAIYILQGEGIVHIENVDTPIRPGTSIFLPPGTPHCLENAGPTTLKLLGVFSPPGSPANKMEHSQEGIRAGPGPRGSSRPAW